MYDTNLVHANKLIITEMLESVKTVKTRAIMIYVIYVILSDYDDFKQIESFCTHHVNLVSF